MKFTFDHSRRFFYADFPASFVLEAAHGDTLNAAGCNGEKRRQAFLGDVDGEAVHRNPFPDSHADGGELTISHPDASEPGAATGLDSEVVAGVDQGIFEFPQVFVEILTAWAEVEDGVADELARAMVGGLPAAVSFVKSVWKGGWIAEGRLIAEATDGVDRLMLHQENRVVTHARKDGSDVGFLKVEARLVVNKTGEVDNF
jgi:hypothetical protein